MGEELWPEQVSEISQSLGPEYGSTWSRWCNIVRKSGMANLIVVLT
jgi:hypothetical protein